MHAGPRLSRVYAADEKFELALITKQLPMVSVLLRLAAVLCGHCCLLSPLPAACCPLLQCLYSQVVQGIASARRLAPGQVEAAVNASPLLASQAVQLGLVDGLAYRYCTSLC